MICLERHISDKFRDESFSDADVSVVLAGPSVQNAQLQEPSAAREELDRFPGHLIVLTRSPYFQTQVNFVRQQEEQRGRGSSTACLRSRSRSRSMSSTRQAKSPQTDTFPLQRRTPASTDSSSSKMTFVLTVDNRAHAPVATAVIASLYGAASPVHSFQEEELVQLIQYADMMQVEPLVMEAVAQLNTAAATKEGLSAATMAALAALPAWPSCMLSLLPEITKHATALDSTAAQGDAYTAAGSAESVLSRNASIQQVLVAALGNLEAVWQQDCLSSTLLELPLPAMQLLLSSDQLQVYSEDTVLFTVNKYAANFVCSRPPTKAKVLLQLSELIRAPHLSDLQLATHSLQKDRAASERLPSMMPSLCKHGRQLQQLQQLRRVDATPEDLPPEAMASWRSSVPSSWLLGPRRLLPPPVDGVTLTWHVPVSQLKALVTMCHDTRCHQSVLCTTLSPPLKGLQWQFWASCKWDDDSSGAYMGIFYSPLGLPDGLYYKFRYSFQSSVGVNVPITSRAGAGASGWGLRDFFELGALTKGWAHAAWVGKGLPLNGNIELKLTVYDVW